MALPIIRWGTSYAAMPGYNPSGNGTSVGVVDTGLGIPAVSLPSRGGECKLGTQEPLLTSGPAFQRYTSKKDSLLLSPNLTSPSCMAFFKADQGAPDYDPSRAIYFPQLTAGVTRQVVYDGPKTTLSRFDAGVLTPAQAQQPNARSIMQSEPVCKIFIPKPLPNGQPNDISIATAAAQAVSRDGDPPKKVYVNTAASVRGQIVQGTVLHETLHNLTGLDDEELRTFVGPTDEEQPGWVGPRAPGPSNPITRKLWQAGCAPPG